MQLLDGVGAGIYQALTPLLIADIMRGTGRYNLAQGAVATTQGDRRVDQRLGGWRSDGPFRLLASRFSFSLPPRRIAFLVFFAFMPETRDEQAMALAREDAVALEGAPDE